jgi:hypothetical protein
MYPWAVVSEKPRAWPVIGPRHEDAKIIKFSHWHYHVDARFIAPRTWAFLERSWKGPEYAVASTPLCWRPMPEHPPIVFKERRCWRNPIYLGKNAVLIPWLVKLQNAHAECRLLGPQKRCPHQGAPLASVHADAYGIVTCPLHGLRWHADTGLPAWSASTVS